MEFAFQSKYGSIVRYEWIEKDQFVVAFSNGYVIVMSAGTYIPSRWCLPLSTSGQHWQGVGPSARLQGLLGRYDRVLCRSKGGELW